MTEAALPSTRPYFIRALHEWCADHGFTPYLTVFVGQGVQVPMEFVRDGQITLNIGFDATQGLKLGNEWIEFKARFGGVPREVVVPVGQVIAIFARENNHGLAFPVEEAPPAEPALRLATPESEAQDSPTPPDDPAPRPALKRVK
ncbi:MAG: ClpXP protease specificity-enhancing factor [Burkholderiales bacterium]|uniref:ClpXP protease specificity-enhancing factor n=1 Tax=Inhella sp. TaxID=1921806 RepID=UPI001AC83297|nr:ClpXP protease specificity-enhancing factor [Burkholderiales bacterium]